MREPQTFMQSYPGGNQFETIVHFDDKGQPLLVAWEGPDGNNLVTTAAEFNASFPKLWAAADRVNAHNTKKRDRMGLSSGQGQSNA